MRKFFNLKILNLALWIEVILAYVLPFKVIDNYQYKVGIPFSFITAYEKPLEVNPLMSMYLNPAIFLVNSLIIYAVLILIMLAYSRFKKKKSKE